jgi:tetratricopeptide (TPR) repeat protein
VLEEGHPEIAVSEHNLGDVAFKAGDLKTAEAQYLLAREHWEKRLGPEHVFLGFSDGALGNVYRDLGQRDQAIARYQSALRLMVKGYGPENAATRKSRRRTTR